MPTETLFISDLHLSANRPETTRLFIKFIETRAKGSDRLYILGDLFDAYIGDDDNGWPNREVKKALKSLADQGTAVFFQHGNRDFLVGSLFCQQTGAQLLDDYVVIDAYGEPVLITHGDLLCTDDVLYQAARARVRTEEWKRNALAKPLWLRQLYARWYRFKSGLDKSKKTADIMDVNSDAVMDTFRMFKVGTLIHGHTHRPGMHQIELEDGTTARRMVLAEWRTTGQLLSCDSALHWRTESFD